MMAAALLLATTSLVRMSAPPTWADGMQMKQQMLEHVQQPRLNCLRGGHAIGSFQHARLEGLHGGHAIGSSIMWQRAAPPRMTSDPSRTFGRCEFWAAEKATTLQVVNVIGRFSDSGAWVERTDFATIEDASADTTAQAATEKRNAFAKKFDQVERVAFVSNVPSLPFIDDRLAADVGASVESFAAMPIEPAHLAVVFDALAHSKTTLVKRSDADERIASWRAADGSFDADAFGSGLRTGLVSVLAANVVLYFFLATGVTVVARVGLDLASGA